MPRRHWLNPKKRAPAPCRPNRTIVHVQQLTRKALVKPQLPRRNIAPVALLEPEEKEQNSGKLRGDDRTGAAAFTTTWQHNPLLVEVATEIGINQAMHQLRQRSRQPGRFSFPAVPCR